MSSPNAVVSFKPPPLEMNNGTGGPKEEEATSPRGMDTLERERADRAAKEKEKIGHRRVDRTGEVSYKRVPTNALMGAIQLGIANSIGSLAGTPERDLLLQDFDVIERVAFPPEGSQTTPSHQFGDFRFKTYAPIAFRYFRELFSIKPADFLRSICTEPLKELSNAGASGSVFYVSCDDQFIIKTVQHKEAEFLQKLLPGYYMNLNQNPRTLLPKFFGLFCYQSLGKNIRLLVMNNLLPQAIPMHLKFDLKGSTYKRAASKSERAKPSPTLKDLDFLQDHPDGLFLEAATYDALNKTISRDCLVLESFKIMDYSMLVGVHNIDQSQRDQQEQDRAQTSGDVQDAIPEDVEVEFEPTTSQGAPQKPDPSVRRVQRHKSMFSAWESIQADALPVDLADGYPEGGVPARNARGERLLLFLGIIDILQNYRLFKRLEHTWKSVLHDADTISVHRPGFYAHRFQDFMKMKVFRKIPSLDLPAVKGPHRKFRSLVQSYMALKHSPSRRRQRGKSITDRDRERDGDQQRQRTSTQRSGQGDFADPVSGSLTARPDLVPDDVPASRDSARRLPFDHAAWPPNSARGALARQETLNDGSTTMRGRRRSSLPMTGSDRSAELATVSEGKKEKKVERLFATSSNPPTSTSATTVTTTSTTVSPPRLAATRSASGDDTVTRL